MKNYIKTLSGLCLFSLMTSANVLANEVTTDTPDKVLLADKNLEVMYSVAQPSARLALIVDGVSHPIQVENNQDSLVVYVDERNAQNLSDDEINQIGEVYSVISGNDNVEVKTKEFDFESPISEE